MHRDAMSANLMESTPVSLLERLKRSTDQESWTRFVRLYTPLLYHWARRLGSPSQDASDLVQDVLTVLVQKLPHFTYDPQKRFRGWLWTITLNKLREKARRGTLSLAGTKPPLLEEPVSPDRVTA